MNKNIKKYYNRLEYNKKEWNNSNIFIKRLNKYICNFYSGIWDFNKSTILNKIIEILSSGSLLLISSTQTVLCDKIGLINNINCIIVNIYNKKELINKINYILSLDNREKINEIRENGQKYCIKYFSLEKKYNKFINILSNL